MKPRICGLSLLLSLLFAWCALAPHNVQVDTPPAATVTNR